jgi:hypothetical protein
MSGLETRLENKIKELENKLIMKLKIKSDFEELNEKNQTGIIIIITSILNN